MERPDETDLVILRCTAVPSFVADAGLSCRIRHRRHRKTVHDNQKDHAQIARHFRLLHHPRLHRSLTAQVLGPASLAGLFPQGVRVYLTDTGAASQVRLVDAARHLRDLGYEPVPHLAARRIPSRVEFEEQVKRLAGEAGVSDVLVVGGGVERPAGPFASSMDMLSSGIFDRYGMNQIAIAGHPEGSPDFSEETAVAALRLKRDFAQRSDATMRIVTQFGFDAARFIAWAEGLVTSGIDLPVHIGVSGPAKITTLLKYAALCGVGNSIAYLKKNALSSQRWRRVIRRKASSDRSSGTGRPIRKGRSGKFTSFPLAACRIRPTGWSIAEAGKRAAPTVRHRRIPSLFDTMSACAPLQGRADPAMLRRLGNLDKGAANALRHRKHRTRRLVAHDQANIEAAEFRQAFLVAQNDHVV